jgi:phosphoenolpyruvate carboxykinase (ATP)
MLGRKMEDHKVNVWLVNTGWTGGPNGVGSRLKLPYTRAMITAALKGVLDHVETVPDAIFGVAIPKEVPGVPSEILQPRNTWKNKTAYDEKAVFLANLFIENFKKYAAGVSEEILAAAPKI